MTSIEIKNFIYENNKVEMILESLGCHHIQYHSNKDYYTAANVDGDNNNAIRVVNNKYLNCDNYTRANEFLKINEKPDIITLVQFVLNCDFISSIKYLHKTLGIEYRYTKQSVDDEEKVDPLAIFKNVKSKKRQCVSVNDFDIINEDVLSDYIPMVHIDFYRSGVMPWTVDNFGLGYSYKYKRTIIPLRHWFTGLLLGFNQRTSVDNCEEFGIKKYLITPNYPKSINLFGLWENRKSIEKEKFITVFEAERSVLKRHSLGDETCVALSGHNMSDEQVRIILGLDITEVVIALDKDICLEEIRHICSKFFHIRKVSYIYDKYDLLGSKDSPADMQEKIYKYLFKHRVTYTEKEHREYLKSLE